MENTTPNAYLTDFQMLLSLAWIEVQTGWHLGEWFWILYTLFYLYIRWGWNKLISK